MALTLNTNPSGLNAQNNLSRILTNQSDHLQKIASAKAINKAADDAASLIIGDQLGLKAKGMGQSIRNANDATSLLQIADGALANTTEQIQSIRTTAIQAVNGGHSVESRLALQADIGNALTAISNIAQTTSYNGQQLLDGSFTEKSFQVGPDAGQTVSLSLDAATPGNLGDTDLGRLADINVMTPEGAEAALAITDSALDQVGGMRSTIGSTQNQLASTIENLSATSVNTAASQSSLMDTDFAEASIIKAQMDRLATVGTFALAQANANQKNVLNLLTRGPEF